MANSEGTWTEDRRVRTRHIVQAVAAGKGSKQTGYCGPGLSVGLELFDRYPPRGVGRTAGEQAMTNLRTKPAPAGTFPVVIGNAGVQMQRGVIVAEVSGVHAGTNVISGDFSLQALGLWVEGGEIAYAVENFAVAGDFLTLLMNIAAVGSTLKWDLGGRMAVGTPMAEVADLSFA